MLDLLRVISHHHARLATPIRTVLKTYGEAEAERSPFSDLYTRARAATNPPFLLIEPSNINNDEKTKVSAQSDPNLDVKESSAPNNSGSNPNGKVSEIAASSTEILTAAPVESISSNSKKNIQYQSDVTSSISGDSVSSGESSLNTSRVSQEPGRQTSPAKPPKQDVERSVSVLEDNILLGVALDGSKRTLPIDGEDISHPSITEEPSELASRRKGNGSTTMSKGNKDDQTPPRSTDQRKND